jgi:hypothetical protein
MFRPCGCSTKYMVPLDRIDPSLAASITTTLDLYGHLYPGEMDRYADRLGRAAEDAAEDSGKAKIRPDDGKDEDGEK